MELHTHSGRIGVRLKSGLGKSIAGAALALATCLGGTILITAPAGAAEASAAGVQPSTIGSDGLAPVAVRALATLQEYIRTGDSATLADYTAVRNSIATEVAGRLLVDPALMIAAWDRADTVHQTALMAAFTQLGVPYRRNTSKAGVGFDCSGLTTFAWAAAGVKLTRQSAAQIRAAKARTFDTAMAGDLMYYPGHVMMYLGVDRTMVHSPYSGRTVEVDLMSKRRTPKFGNPVG